jgi:hypothetical protein
MGNEHKKADRIMHPGEDRLSSTDTPVYAPSGHRLAAVQMDSDFSIQGRTVACGETAVSTDSDLQ